MRAAVVVDIPTGTIVKVNRDLDAPNSTLPVARKATEQVFEVDALPDGDPEFWRWTGSAVRGPSRSELDAYDAGLLDEQKARIANSIPLEWKETIAAALGTTVETLETQVKSKVR